MPSLEEYLKELRPVVDKHAEEITKWQVRIDNLPDAIPLEDEALADQVTTGAAGMRKLKKEIDESRKAQAKPWDDRKKTVQNQFKPLLDSCDKQMGKMKGLVDVWHRARRAAAAEEERRLRQEAAKAENEVEAAELEAEASRTIEEGRNFKPAGGAQAMTTTQLVVEVTDKAALLKAIVAGELPDAFVEPNMKEIRGTVRALEMQDGDAPGLKIERVEKTVIK
jgi:hypothetical protein